MAVAPKTGSPRAGHAASPAAAAALAVVAMIALQALQPAVLTALRGSAARSEAHDAQRPLNTYYLYASKAAVGQSTWHNTFVGEGIGMVELRLPLSAVSPSMPVTTPLPSGMVHRSVDAAGFVKAWGELYSVTKPKVTGHFPIAGFAMESSGSASELAELRTKAQAGMFPTQDAPTTFLATLAGPAGKRAITGDVMHVSVDSATSEAVLQLRVVEKPHMLSEFEAHDHQSLATPHYHFYMPASAAPFVGAPQLIEALGGGAATSAALFFKGQACSSYLTCGTTDNGNTACLPLSIGGQGCVCNVGCGTPAYNYCNGACAPPPPQRAAADSDAVSLGLGIGLGVGLGLPIIGFLVFKAIVASNDATVVVVSKEFAAV